MEAQLTSAQVPRRRSMRATRSAPSMMDLGWANHWVQQTTAEKKEKRVASPFGALTSSMGRAARVAAVSAWELGRWRCCRPPLRLAPLWGVAAV